MSNLASIITLSLIVNILATLIATTLGGCFGYLLYFTHFPGKKAVLLCNKTLMGLPPVVLGLILFLLFKRNGTLGFLNLLYTPGMLLIAQVLLIIPIATGNIYQMLEERGKKLFFTLGMFHVKGFKLLLYSLNEYRNQLLFILMLGFSRAVSEVGAVIIVGGNIAGSTRMMTTAIATLKSSGNFQEAIIIGVILLVISLCIQIIFDRLRIRSSHENI